jgi:putative FmdB family regulatory protein
VPIYDYVCANGHTTEVIHGVNDAGPANCPVCGAPLRKAVSAPAIVFKGSGWAKVDRQAKPAAAKSADGDKSAKAGQSGKGGESGTGGESGDGGSSKKATTAAGESAKTDTAKPAGTASSEAS